MCYCYKITITFLLVALVFLVQKLLQMDCTFSGVIYTMMHVVRLAMLTYYRIKCITEQKAIGDIFQNIDYADRSLARDAGVKVPHKTNQIVCTLCSLSFILTSIAVLYFFTHAENWDKISQVLAEKYSEFSVYEKCLAFLSSMLVSMQFIFLLYVINQRLELLAGAILKALEQFDGRKTAWDNRAVCVSVSGTLEEMNGSRVNCTKLQTIYRSINALMKAQNVFILRLSI